MAPRKRIHGNDAARFESKIDRNGPVSESLGTRCWLWTDVLKVDGYGAFMVTLAPKRYKRLQAHRYSYEHFVAPIPDGLDIDHLCRNRRCVNPAHMEPVTRRVNTLRGLRGHRDECIHGHSLTGNNLIVRRRGKYERRECRTCDNARQRERRERRKRLAA